MNTYGLFWKHVSETLYDKLFLGNTLLCHSTMSYVAVTHLA